MEMQLMTWEEARRKLPHMWLVVEATEAYTDKSQRIITQLNVAAICGDDPNETMRQFSALSRQNKDREYYPVHTDREQLDIRVQTAFGRIRR
jgi:hypothetical protein